MFYCGIAWIDSGGFSLFGGQRGWAKGVVRGRTATSDCRSRALDLRRNVGAAEQ